MIKIKSITRVGNIIEVIIEGITEPFLYGLKELRDQEHLTKLIKEQIERILKEDNIQNECDDKYNDWVLPMVGETIA